MSTLNDMRTALKNSAILITEGDISEYLPQYGELTYQFRAGLTVRIAEHPNGKVQATLQNFYYLTECSIPEMIEYLENVS